MNFLNKFFSFVIILCLAPLLVYGNKCPVQLEGECQCKEIIEDSMPVLKVECAQTTAKKLLNDIDLLKKSGKTIIGLQVRDSNLRDLYNLPSGLYNVHELSFDNTGIDLETIRESNELLKLLKKFRVYRENFTEVSFVSKSNSFNGKPTHD